MCDVIGCGAQASITFRQNCGLYRAACFEHIVAKAMTSETGTGTVQLSCIQLKTNLCDFITYYV